VLCVTGGRREEAGGRRRAGGGGREEAGGAPGIQNQKQEPHTKLWGTSDKSNMMKYSKKI